MNRLNYKNITVNVPGTWDELSAVQAESIADAVFSGVPRAESFVAVLMELAGIRSSLFLRLLFFFNAHDEDLAEMKPLTDFCYEKPQSFKKQLFPWLKKGRQKIKGPKDGCSDLTFAEFIKAEGIFPKIKDGGFDEIERLLAVLYRKSEDGWKRAAYDDSDFENRLDIAKNQSKGVKAAIYLWYAWNRDRIAAQFPDIFVKDAKKGAKGNWADVLLELAGGSANVDKVADMNATTVLYDFKRRIDKAKRVEKERQKLNRK